jgi:hypothetical protein
VIEGHELFILHEVDLMGMDDLAKIFKAFAFENHEIDLC